MNKEEIIEIGMIAVGGLALYLVLSRGKSSPPQEIIAPPSTPVAGPEYIAYNYSPPHDNVNLPIVSAATQQSASSSPGPCCLSSQSSMLNFSSPNSFSTYLSSQFKDLEQQYQANLMSSMPDFFSQYLNNSTGAAEGQASINAFTMLGG